MSSVCSASSAQVPVSHTSSADLTSVGHGRWRTRRRANWSMIHVPPIYPHRPTTTMRPSNTHLLDRNADGTAFDANWMIPVGFCDFGPLAARVSGGGEANPGCADPWHRGGHGAEGGERGNHRHVDGRHGHGAHPWATAGSDPVHRSSGRRRTVICRCLGPGVRRFGRLGGRGCRRVRLGDSRGQRRGSRGPELGVTTVSGSNHVGARGQGIGTARVRDRYRQGLTPGDGLAVDGVAHRSTQIGGVNAGGQAYALPPMRATRGHGDGHRAGIPIRLEQGAL